MKYKWELYNSYQKEIKKYKAEIQSQKNMDKQLDLLADLYHYIKEISIPLYEGETMFSGFRSILHLVEDCEALIPNDYIIDTKSNFKEDQFTKGFQQEFTTEEILNYIVHKARLHLHQALTQGHRNANFEEINPMYHAMEASNYIVTCCKKNHIPCERIILEPGYLALSPIFNGSHIQCFNIVMIDDKNYLIDCTYKQFFHIRESQFERMGIVNMAGCNPGTFMTLKDNRKKVAQTLLYQGWIELTDEVLKNYLDGFTIFYRNGLWYEKTKDFSYETSYTAQDYQNFLTSQDNQVNHEPIEELGYQKKPLQNPNLNFHPRG